MGLSAPVPALVPAPYGAIGIGFGIGIVGDCGVGSSVPAANESNGIASQMTPSPASVPGPSDNKTNGTESLMTLSPIILSGDSRVIYNERKQYDNRH